MRKINDLKKIVDDCLQNMQMSETQKQSVLRKTRNLEKPSKKNHKKYRYPRKTLVSVFFVCDKVVNRCIPLTSH